MGGPILLSKRWAAYFIRSGQHMTKYQPCRAAYDKILALPCNNVNMPTLPSETGKYATHGPHYAAHRLPYLPSGLQYCPRAMAFCQYWMPLGR